MSVLSRSDLRGESRSTTRWLLLIVGTLPFALYAVPSWAEDAAAIDFFEKSIRPLIVEKCQSCHGDKKAKAGLRLTDRASLLQGGESGPAVVPHAPDESPLIRAVRYLDEPKMPPKQKLSAGEIAALERWVASGAPWPSSTAGNGDRRRASSRPPRIEPGGPSSPSGASRRRPSTGPDERGQ